MRAYRAKHPDKVRAANRKYYRESREKVKSGVREYRDRTNYTRRYYMANRGRLLKRSRQYRADNIIRRRQYDREYAARQKELNPYRSRERNWKHLYGITKKDYDSLLTKQNGVCAICKKPESSKHHGVLCIDHNHITGAIRGLLCNNCNRGLGLLKDSEKVLKAAVRYLSKAKKQDKARP